MNYLCLSSIDHFTGKTIKPLTAKDAKVHEGWMDLIV